MIKGTIFGRYWAATILISYFTIVELYCDCSPPRVHSPNLPKEECVGDAMRIGSIIIFYLRKIRKAKLFIFVLSRRRLSLIIGTRLVRSRGYMVSLMICTTRHES